MITVMLDRFYYLSDISFPSYKIIFKSFAEFKIRQCVDVCANKPNLQHWVLVADSNMRAEELAQLTEPSYLIESYFRFRNYSIIGARSYEALRNKSRFAEEYIRSEKEDRLFNLRWTSSKMKTNGFKEIASLSSPILLFARYRGYDILYAWASGFLSMVVNGCLRVRLSFRCFSLGDGYNLCRQTTSL